MFMDGHTRLDLMHLHGAAYAKVASGTLCIFNYQAQAPLVVGLFMLLTPKLGLGDPMPGRNTYQAQLKLLFATLRKPAGHGELSEMLGQTLPQTPNTNSESELQILKIWYSSEHKYGKQCDDEH